MRAKSTPRIIKETKPADLNWTSLNESCLFI